MKGSVMVFLEQNRGKLSAIGLELLSRGKNLADTLEVPLTGALMAQNMDEDLTFLGKYGADLIYFMESPLLEHFTALPYSRVLVDLIKAKKPQIVLYGATTTGRALAPRIASALKCGLTADCTALEIDEKGKLVQIRPAFGGNIIATILSPQSNPSMATVREGVMPLKELDNWKPAEIQKINFTLEKEDCLTEVVDLIYRESSVNLKGARIIVSAGMGASNRSSLDKVQQLADTLGAPLGCSRPMVDSGILSKDHQVGQTGVTVRPNLYIACGISGQIQHRAGMGESKRIIAINRDPQAPIFSIANYGIVGDLNEVIPRFIKAYRDKV